MPSLDERREILEHLNLLAVQDITDLWRNASMLDLDSPSFRGVIARGVPELIAPYESTAGELTALWYEESAPELAFRATPAALTPGEQLATSTRWALGAAGDVALTRIAGFTQRAIFNASRETIIGNHRREPGSTWARHASSNACAFCKMMATRGAVYSTKEAARYVGAERWEAKRNYKGQKVGHDIGRAGRVRGTQPAGEKYHDKCFCTAIEVRPGHSYEPPPYVEKWNEEYIAAVRATDGVGEFGAIDTKAVLAHMRASESSAKAARVAAAADKRAPAPKSGGGGGKPPIKPPAAGKIVAGGDDGESLPKRLTRAEADTPHIEITAQNRRHILDGEPDKVTAGGHRSGVGRPGKTEFPPDWDDDRIIAAVRATVEEHHWTLRAGDATLRRLEVDGVIVEVASYPKNGEEIMRHAYPVNGNGVVKNDRATGEAHPRELDRSVLYQLPPQPRKR